MRKVASIYHKCRKKAIKRGKKVEKWCILFAKRSKIMI